MATEAQGAAPSEGAGAEPEVYDVLIVGGGPAGATAALYAARAGFSTIVLDKGVTAGALGLTSRIANYPGVPEVLGGAELVGRMRDQAAAAGARFVHEKVLVTSLADEVKEAHTGQGVYRARAVIIATGSMGRTHTIPGEERLLGRGVSYCAVCDGAFFEGQDVAVVGNNDEALEEALYLARLARRVFLLSQTPALTASPGLTDEAERTPNLEVRLGHRVREVLGDGEVEGLHVAPREGDEYVLPVSAAFVYLQGGKPITDFLYGELPTSEAGCLEVDEAMQTGVRGVFAAGDVLCVHVKQVVVAAAEGATAAMSAQRYLSGRDRVRPDWT